MDGDSSNKGSVQIQPRIESILAGGMSQARLAKEVGVSSAAVNQWLKGCYGGDNEGLERKLATWIETCDARQAEPLPAAPSWVETPTGRRVISGLTFAQNYADIAMIHGAPGLGKTFAIRQYTRTFPNVWLMTACPTTGSKAAALQEIAEAVGLRGLSNRPNETRREIVRKVTNTRGLIVIDEAQHLQFESFECLRRIYDEAEIGIALCGNDGLYSKLTVGARKVQFAQIFSRIGRRVHLGRSQDADVTALCEAWAVTGNKEIAYAKEIAAQPGALRGLVKTLRLSAFAAMNEEGQITFPIMRDAWIDLRGDA